MIIPESSLETADKVFSDPLYHEATLVIHCGSDGLFVGKVFLDRKRILSTGGQVKFKKALSLILEMLAEDYGE